MFRNHLWFTSLFPGDHDQKWDTDLFDLWARSDFMEINLVQKHRLYIGEEDLNMGSLLSNLGTL